MALKTRGLWFAWSLVLLSQAVACSSELDGKTEVLVSIDAIGNARNATMVRIEVNAAVVELPRTGWPLEVLVSAPPTLKENTFRMRAFGMLEQQVLGAAKTQGTFKKGKRVGLEVKLDPLIDAGPLPEVNTQVGPNKLVVQPKPSTHPGEDAGDLLPGLDAGDGQADAGGGEMDAGAPDSGPAPQVDASTMLDSGVPGCVQEPCFDGDAALTVDACVPQPTDCGGCGMSCDPTLQCVDDDCLEIPKENCVALVVSGRNYRYCQDLRNWDNARVACRSLNLTLPNSYDLAIMETELEYNAVFAAVASINGQNYWLGGQDMGDNGNGSSSCTRGGQEGVWNWVETAGEAGVDGPEFCRFANSSASICTPTGAAFTAWDVDQPDNHGCSCPGIPILNLLLPGPCGNAEDCLMVQANGKWNDTACTDARTYLCEQYP